MFAEPTVVYFSRFHIVSILLYLVSTFGVGDFVYFFNGFSLYLIDII